MKRRAQRRSRYLAGASPLVLPRRHSSRGPDFLETRRRQSFRGTDFLETKRRHSSHRTDFPETRRRHSSRGTDFPETPKGDRKAARTQSGASFQHTRHSTKRLWRWAFGGAGSIGQVCLNPSSRRQIFPKKDCGARSALERMLSTCSMRSSINLELCARCARAYLESCSMGQLPKK